MNKDSSTDRLIELERILESAANRIEEEFGNFQPGEEEYREWKSKTTVQYWLGEEIKEILGLIDKASTLRAIEELENELKMLSGLTAVQRKEIEDRINQLKGKQ